MICCFGVFAIQTIYANLLSGKQVFSFKAQFINEWPRESIIFSGYFNIIFSNFIFVTLFWCAFLELSFVCYTDCIKYLKLSQVREINQQIVLHIPNVPWCSLYHLCSIFFAKNFQSHAITASSKINHIFHFLPFRFMIFYV